MNYIPKKFCDPHIGLKTAPDAPVLVALSGGADSAALLHIMCLCREKHDFRLCAAHVNHNIRTEKYNNEAKRDENFCRELCRRLGVELFVLSVDIPSLASKTGESTETVARNARYGFFEQIMQSEDIKILLTAHNASDNLETQIFNLCRGCSVKGIAGIPRTRHMGCDSTLTVFRPLLDMSKPEILEYCSNCSIDYVTDSTNLEGDYTRNRIRHNIIPELEQIFQSPAAAASRLALSATEDSELLTLQAKEIFMSLQKKTEIPLDMLKGLHPSLGKRLVCLAYSSLSESTLEAVHINSLLSLADSAVPHSSVSLPNMIRARIESNSLVFEKSDDTKTVAEPTDYLIRLSDGVNIIPNTDFAVVISDSPNVDKTLEINKEIYKLYTSAHIKNAKILPLYARGRHEGDKIHTCGMTKSVKKLQCEKKLPLCERYTLPVIADSDKNIIYVPKCAVSDIYSCDCTPIYIFIYKSERTAI